MGTDTAYVQVALPETLRVEYERELSVALAESGAAFKMRTSDSQSTDSNLSFDPITIGVAVWVVDIVVTSAAAYLVPLILKRVLAKKEQALKASILLPDGRTIVLETGDEESFGRAVRELGRTEDPPS